MKNAELAAIARMALSGNWISRLSVQPEFDKDTARHLMHWSPERALAALAVIESARVYQVMIDLHCPQIIDTTNGRALAAWDALQSNNQEDET